MSACGWARIAWQRPHASKPTRSVHLYHVAASPLPRARPQRLHHERKGSSGASIRYAVPSLRRPHSWSPSSTRSVVSARRRATSAPTSCTRSFLGAPDLCAIECAVRISLSRGGGRCAISDSLGNHSVGSAAVADGGGGRCGDGSSALSSSSSSSLPLVLPSSSLVGGGGSGSGSALFGSHSPVSVDHCLPFGPGPRGRGWWRGDDESSELPSPIGSDALRLSGRAGGGAGRWRGGGGALAGGVGSGEWRAVRRLIITVIVA